MRNINYIRHAIIGSMFGVLVLVGTALTANAQNQSEEYREWQRAQAKAEQEHRDYLRTRRPADYRQWQAAQRAAQQEYAEYQQANRFNNNNNTNRGNNRARQYRVYRDGSYYSTDSRGAELLKTAVRNGYSQGYRQGQMDKRNGRGNNYTDDSQYRSGTYGYQSYVERGQYQHYYQQGFQRGYDDGYNSTTRYGTRSGTILGNILNTILNFSDDNN